MTRLLRFLDKAMASPSQGFDDVHQRLTTMSRRGYVPSVAEVEMLVRYLVATPLVVDSFASTFIRSNQIHFDAWNLMRRQPLAPTTRGFWELHAAERRANDGLNCGIDNSLDAFDSDLLRFKPTPWTSIEDLLVQVIRWSYRHGWRPVTGVELDLIRETGRSTEFGRVVDIGCIIESGTVILRTTSFPLAVFKFAWEGNCISVTKDRIDSV